MPASDMRKVMGLLTNIQGIFLLTYFLVVTIICFVQGLKGIVESAPPPAPYGEESMQMQANHQAKIHGWIYLLISITSILTSLWIMVLWTFLNSKLKKEEMDHHHHHNHRQRTIPFSKMLLALGLLSLTFFLALIIIQFSYAPWFMAFFTGTPNYVGGMAGLILVTLYLVTYFIVVVSAWLSDRCCRESDWYDYGAYGVTDEQREKNRRIARFLQIYILIRR